MKHFFFHQIGFGLFTLGLISLALAACSQPAAKKKVTAVPKIIDPTGTFIMTIMGNGAAGNQDASSTLSAGGVPAGSFAVPTGLAIDANLNLYIADSKNNRIRMATLIKEQFVTAKSKVSLPNYKLGPLYGSGTSGRGNGAGTFALLYYPVYPVFIPGKTKADPSYVAFSDNANQVIRIGNLSLGSFMVNNLAGNLTDVTTGFNDGPGAGAKFFNPNGMVFDSSNSFIYLADKSNHTIRRIAFNRTDSSSTVSTIAGAAGQADKINGNGLTARFNNPIGLAMDSSGNLWVADQNNFQIRKITFNNDFTVQAVSTVIDTSSNGISLIQPSAIAIDTINQNRLYIADSQKNQIYTYGPADASPGLTLLAGTGTSGANDATTGSNPLLASFNQPNGLAIANSGKTIYVYVTDSGNNLIRLIKIVP